MELWGASSLKTLSFLDVVKSKPSLQASQSPMMSSSYLVEKFAKVSALEVSHMEVIDIISQL
jgi:hypothetical protein